jgi:RNA 3'-phosphate cyclase
LNDLVAIDGSRGEGGGQILRTALALAAVTGRPCRIANIRARRPNPGLQAQHLAAVAAAEALSAAASEGARHGSTDLLFRPQALRGGTFHVAVGTAGAATLVLETAITIALFAPAPVTITVTGGTDVPWSPTVDYLAGVFLAHLARLGARVRLDVARRGVYPQGGGEVRATIEPWRPLPATGLDLRVQGGSPRLAVTSMADTTLARARVAERQLDGFAAAADPGWGALSPEIAYAPMRNPGTSITARLVTGATILGASALGERGKRAERVGREAAELLHEEWGSDGALDRWMADQIIPFLGLLGGEARASAITAHAETNLRIAERFLPVRFAVHGTMISARRGAAAQGAPPVVRS